MKYQQRRKRVRYQEKGKPSKSNVTRVQQSQCPRSQPACNKEVRFKVRRNNMSLYRIEKQTQRKREWCTVQIPLAKFLFKRGYSFAFAADATSRHKICLYWSTKNSILLFFSSLLLLIFFTILFSIILFDLTLRVFFS